MWCWHMTTQVKEQIIIDGQKYPLLNALSLPEDDSIIQHKKGVIETSSNCWRGYVGTWEIKADTLYLIDFSSGKYDVLVNLPILADWISGTAKVATGEVKDSSSWNIETYETETHLTFENGQKSIEENYKNGKLNGEWLAWYDNGKQKTRGNYLDGKKDGDWMHLWEDGCPLITLWKNGEDITYENGTPF